MRQLSSINAKQQNDRQKFTEDKPTTLRTATLIYKDLDRYGEASS